MTTKESDSRKSYILRIASHLVSLNLVEEKLPNVGAFLKFCDTDEQRLVVTRLDSKGHVDVRNDVQPNQNFLFRVIFYKQNAQPLTSDYKREVSVLTANQDQPSDAFLGTIKQVYGDILPSSQQNGHSSNIDHSNGVSQLSSGFSLQQELKHWTQHEDPGNYTDIMEPLFEKYSQLDQMSLDECEEFVEISEFVLDGLWNSAVSYPQSRMRQLIDAISYQIYTLIKQKIQMDAFWSSPSALDQLYIAQSLCDQWILSVRLLTTQTWVTHTTEWRGEAARLDLITAYKHRLDAIAVVRRLCNQVSVLLDERGGSTKIAASVEQLMSNTNPFIYDASRNEEIAAKLRKAEALLDSHIEGVLPALRSKLSDSSGAKGNPVAEIYKYREILARPSVRSKLQANRESLFMRIVEHFRLKRRQYEDRQNDVPLPSRYLTEIGAKVVWIRSNLVQFREIDEVCQNLFVDLASYAQFDRELKAFMSELKNYETEQFDTWCKELLQEIDDPSNSIALETKGRLMKLDKEKGTLSVSYSDRLVGLLREVSQLSSLGFNVPRKIAQCTRVAEQFYRYGNVLKQVAHFYNTIEQQMLPCQQAMMIEEALKFERLLMPKDSKDGVNITWDEPKKLQDYIEQLQEAALNLTNHNRLLRKAHMDICIKVLRLVNMDMIKDIDKWSGQVAEIRQRFADEERRVANPANMRPWAIHWDRQLHKIVQLQFQWGLESLQANSGTVQVQLVLRDQNLQLRPNLHEIKAKYYEDMQKFFSLPSTLKSIQRFNNTNQSPFASIPLANADRFTRIYAESERHFIELASIEQRYAEWLWLSRLNVEELVADNFTQASDWERQLTALKTMSRKADDLPPETVIGPITVSLLAFKGALNTMLRRMSDTLVWTLRHSINTGIQAISNAIKQGMETLTAKPQSMQEVGETNKQYVVLKKDLSTMIDQDFKLSEQNALLRRLTGNGIADLNELNNEMERYKQMLEMFDEIIKEQVDAMKESMGDRVRQLEMDAERLYAHWTQFRPSPNQMMDEDTDALRKSLDFIREHQQKFESLNEQYESLRHDCEQFELADVNVHVMDQLKTDLESTQSNYQIYEEFDSELRKLGEMEWILFRNKAYLFDEFLSDWATKLKSQTTMTPIVLKLQKMLDSMVELSPVLKYCRGDALSLQHWAELFRLIGLPRGTSLETLTFNDLLGVRAKIVSQVEELKNLSSKAQGEAAIREALQELELWAAQAEFQLTDYKHSNGQTIKIIREWKEPMYQVKDNQTLLMSLKNSQHYAQFKDQTSVWEKRVSDLDIYLQQMNQIQRRWVYLEPIFGRGALPAERARFQRADTEFRSILYEVGRDARLATLANQKSLARQLEEIADQLNRCQRALNDFLEVKRVAFPRFYFLGDDDMLEILGQSTNPAIIQNHLKKLFQGIDRVIFDNDQRQIRGIVSPEGEQMSLLKPVQIVAEVEVYLKNLVDEIKATLKKLLLDCLAESALDPGRYPTQIVCLAEEVRFTRDVEQLLESGGSLETFKSQLEQQLSQFTQVKIADPLMSMKLKSLVLDIIHHIEVINALLKAGKSVNIKSWSWQKQIRFYVQSNEVRIRHATAEFAYTYEYQGCAAKLVHTALTDKCYLTLTQALSLGLGGNPFGPAGTGKTESVKALANLMGRQVLVFNCDEGIDVQAIGRMFIGLIQCGAWGCFDEFNRLDKDVLSTVSSQVQTIQDAIRSRSQTCELNQRRVNVDTNAAIFITLNPVGKGYGGRQRMPDNLKQLFRPVVMSKPNNLEIAETLLFAEGYKEAKRMAQKIVTVFDMSRDLLSNQQHYDWGLRSMKTVLKSCGSALESSSNVADTEEESLVVHSLMLSTLSKLTFADFRHFNSLLDDVFPGARKRIDQFEEMLTIAKKVGTEHHLQLNEAQLTKIMELNEQLNRRMGVVVVGPPGAGKTTLWRVLKQTLERQNISVDLHTMNPKSMPKTKFIGEMNLDTREWSDGVLTSISREVVKDATKRAWIVCDGDVDPDWIEALNSVLDDNKLLTMPTGERIQFASNVNFIFETDSLAHASPATISRMGMIYISDEIVDASAQVYRLVKTRHVDEKSTVEWLRDQLPRALDWHSAVRDSEMATSKVALIENVFSFTWNADSLDEFKVGLFRGLAPYTPADSQPKLAQELLFRDLNPPDPTNLCNVYFDSNSRSIQSFGDDLNTTATLASMRYEETRPSILTGRMKVARDTVSKWLEDENRESFCVIGPDGAGKDQLLKASFADHYKSSLVRLNCGAQTSTLDIMQLLNRHCVQTSSASGRALKPKDKDFLILYLKSIDLIQPDKYGSSMTIAFLESLLNYSGFYDTNNDWTTLENVQIVCTFAYPSSSGRAPIPLRFFCRTRCMYMDPPNDNELVVICSAYLMPILNDFLRSAARVESYAASLVQVYKRIKDGFAAASQTHYAFSTRDLINWILALMRYQFTEDNVHSMLGSITTFESRRIFRDRLISIEHAQLFDSIVVDTFGEQSAVDVFAPIAGAFLWHSSAAVMGKPIELTQRQAYITQLAKSVKRYEFEVANFPYILSDELIDLCIAMDRALTQSGGSLLVAGPSDTSQRGVASLVANMHGFRVFSPRVSGSYTLKHFCQDLKQAMSAVALEPEPAVFLLEDYQLLDDKFLQYVNQLLATSNIPGLFTQQEFEQMSGQLRDLASQDGYDGELAAYFANKVKRNLHLAILLDTDHPRFGERLQTNPSLYKFCSVVWRISPTRDLLTQSARIYLESSQINVDPALLDIFCEFYVTSPEQVRTPPKFSAFLQNFTRIYKQKQQTVDGRLKRLRAGVDKLTDTRDQVAKMQQKAAKKSKLLAEKQEAADRALAQITQSMTGAKEQRVSMEQLRIETEKESLVIEEQKKLIEDQLKEVEPMLQEARKAVGSIKSESLSEIRSLRAPPEAIRDILQAVLFFMGILDNSWEAMRKFLAKNGVKDEIINFDARKVAPDVHKRVQQLVKSKANSFDEKVAKRASIAAAPLAAWVMANLEYTAILEKIQPLEKEKNSLLKKFQQTDNEMKNLSSQLTSVDKHVEELRKDFEESMRGAAQIKIDLDREQAAIQVAGTMVDRLGSEFERWQQQMLSLQTEMSRLDQNCALAAAFVTYLGCEAYDKRQLIVPEWLRLCQVDRFDVVAFLVQEVEQQKWRTSGLPPTKMGTENACILFNTTETPLIIDSTGGVVDFLLKFHKQQNPNQECQLLKPTQSDFLTQVELGVRFGKTLVIDDIYTVEPAMVPLLRKEFSTQGPRQVCTVGDKQIDVNEHFRLFLCTRNEQIRLQGHVKAAVTEVNFSTTLAGLSSQILSLALNIERPELEEQSVNLASEAELLNLQLAEIEQVLLNQLATLEGSLLENTQLLDSLNQSKESAEKAEKSLANLDKIRREIDEQKQLYMPFAERCSLLYFAFSDMHRENHMYNFNVGLILDLFREVFVSGKETNSQQKDPTARLQQIYTQLVHSTFYHVSRAVFKQDRLAFALRFVRVIQSKLFQEKEWLFFIGQSHNNDDDNTHSSSQLPSWIPQTNHASVSKLHTHLPQLYAQLNLDDRGTWSEFATGTDHSLPSTIETKLSPFQRVLAVQALRPDRLNTSMTNFVCSSLGIQSINPPSSNLGDLLSSTRCGQPIFLVLGTSADPAQELQDLADKSKAEFHLLAMGNSQQHAAMDLLRKCIDGGSWLCLSNLHLVPEFLLKIHGLLSTQEPKSTFRLWLTSEPDDSLPAVQLQQSLKVAYETPPGIRQNLQRTLAQWIELEQNNASTNEYLQRAYFILAWLHALVQERRTYIPQGWLKFYEFNANDLRVARQTLEGQTKDSETNWEAVRGFMEDAIYGGRIEQQLDIGILRAYLQQYMSKEMVAGSNGELRPGLRLPRFNRLSECAQFVKTSIAETDSPSTFGLPENLLATWEIVQSQRTVSKLRESEGGNLKAAAGGDFFFNDWSAQLTPILAFWKKLNQSSDLLQATVSEVRGSEDPLLEMLSTELHFAVSLLKRIHASLSLVRKGLSGKLSPNAKTIQLAKSLAKHETPIEWDLCWSGPQQCFDYMELVCAKAKHVKAMAGLSDTGPMFAAALNLDDFFRPTALFNALRQFTGRRLQTNVNDLQFATSLSRLNDSSIPQLQLGHLKIQGANLAGQLNAIQANAPTFASTPPLFVAWISMTAQLPYSPGHSVEVPLFVADDRSEHIAQIRLPCAPNEQWQWVVASVALFTRTN